MPNRVEAIITKYDRLLAAQEDSTIARVNAALSSAYDLLEQELLKSYAKIAPNDSLLPNQRKLLILDEVKTLLHLINSRDALQIEKDFNDLLRGSYGQGVQLSEQLAEAIANQTLAPFSSVPIGAIAAQARDGMTRLNKHDEVFASKASATVEMGLSLGWGTQKIARQLRGNLGILKGQAEAIARTESIAAYNTAAVENYHRNGIDEVQLVATSDPKTCPVCQARNGYVYKIGTIKLPLHVNDRCVLVPSKSTWRELGLTNDAWMRDFRAKALAELDGDPNYGASPFEKAAGATKAPTPVWTPETPPAKVKPEAKATDLALPHDNPVTHQQFIENGRAIAGEKFLANPTVKAAADLRSRLIAGSSLSQKEALAIVNAKEFFDADTTTVNPQAVITAHAADYFRLTNGLGSKSLKEVIMTDDDVRAASNEQDRSVQVYPQKRVIFHELAHHIEYDAPDIKAVTNNWIKERAQQSQKRQDVKPELLNEIVPGTRYSSDELAYRGKFINPYVGKVYDTGNTEVISMGLEHFADEDRMAKLASKDPDHFALVLGIIRTPKERKA